MARYTLCGIPGGAQGELSPRRDWSEAEVLAEGFAANPSTLSALQQYCRFSNEQAAAACGVSPRTYRRWRSVGNPPAGALRLLAVLAGYLPWDGWHGWEVHNGYLFPPGYRRGGILPGEFLALVFNRQQVSHYQQENSKLKARVQALEQDSLSGLRAQVQALEDTLGRYRSAARALVELQEEPSADLHLVQAVG